MGKFKCQFSDKPFVEEFEAGGGEEIVDAAGYVPAEQQILTMINAGIRLDENRKEMYDYEGHVTPDLELGDIGFDVTRLPNTDPADIAQLQLLVNARLAEQAAAAEKAAAEPAAAEPPTEEDK